MPSTADIIIDDMIKVLVFARFKQGKTFGALSFPRPNVIDFDHGIRTVLNPDFVKRYGLRHVEFFQPRRNVDSAGVPKDYNVFDNACRYFDEWMKLSGSWRDPDTGTVTKTSVDQFDTWVLDSATTLIDASTDKAIILLGKKEFEGARSTTYDEARKFGLVASKKQDFGAERSMTEQFVRMLRDSGKHVVIVCHEQEQSDSSGNIIGIGPLLTGKSREDIPIMFDEVYRLTCRPSGMDFIRELQTQPIGGVKVGSRIGVPNGTAWDYETLAKVISDIRSTQRQLLQAAKQPVPAGQQTAAKQGA